MADVVGISLLHLAISVAWVVFVHSRTNHLIWPGIVILSIGAQLYPLNEYLQLHQLGPEFIRHHLSSFGYSLGIMMMFGLFLGFIQASQMPTPMYRPTSRAILTPRLYRSLFLAGVSTVTVMAAFEIYAVLILRLRSQTSSPLYSKSFDWIDLGASALAVGLAALAMTPTIGAPLWRPSRRRRCRHRGERVLCECGQS